MRRRAARPTPARSSASSQEARAVNQIGHPNIVDVFAFGALPDGRSYFVMEWLQGETLCERHGRSAARCRSTSASTSSIRSATRSRRRTSKGIVHRDLKPDNVFLVAGARAAADAVKLLDFGVAKLPASRRCAALARAAGMRDGHARATSRPSRRAASDVDTRTDIYALGVMAYEMFLGRLPFVADTAADVIALHLCEPPPPPRDLWPEIPPPLEALLLSMLAKEAEQRPSLDEVRAGLAAARAPAAVPTAEPTPPSLPAAAGEVDATPSAPGSRIGGGGCGRPACSSRRPGC